ncbi:hypothetical protein SORBI_3003G259901 [Sorghum bicolor]|uniref:Uncharacterized protein n=1 Tax=Sorghum bicolor TaxID=4558 RepID=A0A1W0VYY5_SORBI|nr:hypothetical protein SORBI_3003G259901 [Sorghum bicolor]
MGTPATRDPNGRHPKPRRVRAGLPMVAGAVAPDTASSRRAVLSPVLHETLGVCSSSLYPLPFHTDSPYPSALGGPSQYHGYLLWLHAEYCWDEDYGGFGLLLVPGLRLDVNLWSEQKEKRLR